MFCSLHNHTEFSNGRFLDATVKVKDLIHRAIELGYCGVACTDHECLSAAVELSQIEDKIKVEHPDFKIIRGNEIYLIDETAVGNTNKFYHFLLLAKDEEGWNQLRRLSSRAWERAYTLKGIMRTPTTYQDVEEIIGGNPGHIIGSMACIGSEIGQSILEHDAERLNTFIPWVMSVFGKGNFFLEMQPSDSEEQRFVNTTVLQLADCFELPYIITTDTHYLEKGDFSIHSAFLNSRTAADRETEKFYRYTYMMTEQEMSEILGRGGLTQEQIGIGFANTVKIAEQIQTYEYRCSTIVPRSKIPQFKIGHTFDPYYSTHPTLKQFAQGDSLEDKYLVRLIELGLQEKGIQIDESKADRLETELSVINKVSIGLNQKVSSYFLLMREVIDIVWQYSFVGSGRGSSSGFYINYLIGLTQIDPLKYNLPYWRFLNDVRFELPDVDTDASGPAKENIMNALRQYYGYDNVLNCATFKSESLKAAILSAMKGLGYSNDEAQELSSMVPIDRGHVYTLEECANGNEDLDLDAHPEVITRLKQYPRLFETVEKISGLRLNASIHASAVYIQSDGYLAHNSLMRAPNGTRITAFDMDDTNALSGLKIDLLFTDAQTKMMKCMDLLLKAGVIQWQGSLRATYNKYLHPDVLDYENVDMWEAAAAGTIANLFQWETSCGQVAIGKAHPRSIMELATINSAIRVQSDGSVQPIDRYIAFKNNIELWYQEMRQQGLNQDEIELLKTYLSPAYGCSLQQEDFMRLCMDSHIAGFSLKDSNTLRKIIAHKKLDELAKMRDKFYAGGEQCGASEALITYVWDYCIMPLAKYSFSIIHAVAYSVVALQEMNLATRYNPLFWACACLCVNAGSSATDFEGNNAEDFGDEEDVDSFDEEVVEEDIDSPESAKKSKTVTVNYPKIAKAISDAQLNGVTIALPDINSAQLDFIPDVKHNAIVYSLSTVTNINQDLANTIIAGRPYSSLEDFMNRLTLTPVQMISLIKAGSFDSVEQRPRQAIMRSYLESLARTKVTLKEKVTAVHLGKAIDLNIVPEDFNSQIRMFNYKKWVDKNEKQAAQKLYVIVDPDSVKFFEIYLKDKLTLGKEYDVVPAGYTVKPSAFEKKYKEFIAPLMDWFSSEEGRQLLYQAECDAVVQEMWDKYCQGSLSAWEMSSMSFYYSGHELASMQSLAYNLRSFKDLPEELKPIRMKKLKSGKYAPVYDIVGIAGTVVGANNNKHIVSLLTPTGVVDVKFYAGSYIHYNKNISTVDSKGKKTMIEKSWFTRGNKLLIYGVRQENMFLPKTDYDKGIRHSVNLIESVGTYPKLKLEREN